MGKEEESLSRFAQGFNCAQSVLSTYCPQLGLDRECGLRLTGALGGGVAGTGETCGAVVGALLVIGLAHASTEGHDAVAKERTRGISHRFLERFQSAHGSCRCKDLLNCDIATAEGKERARAENLFETLCPRFVAGAVHILGDVL